MSSILTQHRVDLDLTGGLTRGHFGPKRHPEAFHFALRSILRGPLRMLSPLVGAGFARRLRVKVVLVDFEVFRTLLLCPAPHIPKSPRLGQK